VTQALLVAAGGAAGALLRWAVTLALAPSATSGTALPTFPWATLAVNLVGCAFMGALAALTGPKDDARLLLGTGVLGGFTTFSAFGLETLTLLRAGAHGLAAANVLANVLLGVLLAAGSWKAAGG
jgi:CrcB protein